MLALLLASTSKADPAPPPLPPSSRQQAMALLLPDASGSKLELQPDALAALSKISGRVAVVSAIGQYRSGKSYLLNQLMGLPCASGFIVGHERHTQTKGVWFLEGSSGEMAGDRSHILYFDTEGFDATGKAAVYDDRIFAFSTLISSAMLYNLVETIKEADVEKLSFVAQLSQEFWRRSQAPPPHSAGGGATKSVSSKSRGSHRPLRGSEWMPPSLLWLVQRDFLQGSTVDEYLRAALKVTDTAAADEHAKRLNQIRKVRSFHRKGRGNSNSACPHQLFDTFASWHKMLHLWWRQHETLPSRARATHINSPYSMRSLAAGADGFW